MYKRQLEIFVPQENLNTFRKKYPKSIVYSVSELQEIDKNIYLSGQLGTYLKEQSMYLKTLSNELIVLVGCSHPGLEEILAIGKKLAKITGIIGGLHNLRNFSCLKDLKLIGACHCTKNSRLIKQQFPEEYKELHVGTSLQF